MPLQVYFLNFLQPVLWVEFFGFSVAEEWQWTGALWGGSGRSGHPTMWALQVLNSRIWHFFLRKCTSVTCSYAACTWIPALGCEFYRPAFEGSPFDQLWSYRTFSPCVNHVNKPPMAFSLFFWIYMILLLRTRFFKLISLLLVQSKRAWKRIRLKLVGSSVLSRETSFRKKPFSLGKTNVSSSLTCECL